MFFHYDSCFSISTIQSSLFTSTEKVNRMKYSFQYINIKFKIQFRKAYIIYIHTNKQTHAYKSTTTKQIAQLPKRNSVLVAFFAIIILFSFLPYFVLSMSMYVLFYLDLVEREREREEKFTSSKNVRYAEKVVESKCSIGMIRDDMKRTCIE